MNIKHRLTPEVVIGSTLVWLVTFLTVIVSFILSFLLLFLNLKLRNKIVTSLACTFTFTSKYLCGVNYTIEGLENINKIKGPGVLVSNHQSTWETIAFTTIFPQHIYVLKRELLKLPFFGWSLLALGAIPIDRSKGSESLNKVLSEGSNRVKRGFWIMLFPQGTRVSPDVRDSVYKTGAAKFAIGLELPLIPISHNAGYCMPKSSFFLYPGTITIKVGEPIYTNKNMNPEALSEEIKQIIEAKVERF